MKAESERSNGPRSAGILAGEAVSNSVHALLSAAIDYAGLFPPTTLPMSQAVASYAAYRAGEQAWALGRFIVPVARLEEFGVAFASQRGAGRWRLSALVGVD